MSSLTSSPALSSRLAAWALADSEYRIVDPIVAEAVAALASYERNASIAEDVKRKLDEVADVVRERWPESAGKE